MNRSNTYAFVFILGVFTGIMATLFTHYDHVEEAQIVTAVALCGESGVLHVKATFSPSTTKAMCKDGTSFKTKTAKTP